MSEEKPSYDELRQRLDKAEAALNALRRGEVDLVIGTDEPVVVRFKSLAEEIERLARSWEITFGAINDAVWILDREQRIVQSNRRAGEIFGKSKENILGRLCCEIVHGSGRPIAECPVLRSKHSLNRETIELPFEDRWFQVTADPILDSEGNYAGAVHIVSDITERKRIEAERERLMAAIEQAGEVVIITDLEANIQYVNPAFEKVTGYTREESIGKTPRILKSGKQDEAFYRGLWETITSGRTWTGRMVNRRKDGTLYTEESTISPVKGASGQIVNFVAVKHDITEHLRITNEQALLREQLQQAQKLESVGRLAGGVAHDYNNMLSVILGYGDILLNKLHPGDPLRDDVKEILEAGKRSETITRQLLAFSRKQPLQPRVLDLNALIRKISEMLRRLLGEDIRLELPLSDTIGCVMADQGQIEQVIMNLAVNARDAMPKGGTLILETRDVYLDETYAKSHTGVTPGKYVMLAVTDTGCGMDKETMSKVFEPFFTTKEMGKGTGLGLATVYGIVKQSGGNIWVYSEPGLGTTFKIYLPQTEARELQKPAEVERDITEVGREHILVVEDEGSLRKLMEKTLSHLNYKVTLAANGGEALLLIEEKGLKPDLVITDVIMPNMSGKELMDRLRRNQPDLKVIYMSGYTDNSIAHHGVLDPGTPFIQKPFTRQEISDKIKAVLKRT